MDRHVEAIRAEIHRRALLMAVDNPRHGANFNLIETAMLVGASVVMETPIDLDDPFDNLTPQTELVLKQLFEG